MIKLMKNKDAFGEFLLYLHKNPKSGTREIIERDDGLIEASNYSDRYLSEYSAWGDTEKKAMKLVKGRVLDVGCGGGRHSLYLQNKRFDVTGIDNSPGAIKVCKLRGLKKAKLLAIEDIGKFKANSFDTVIMMGNNFSLFGSPKKGKALLKKLYKITSPDARIIAETRNPYDTNNKVHLAYHRFNKKRGRLPGQLRLRVRFKNIIGDWFDYFFVSPNEMKNLLKGTGWKLKKVIKSKELTYMAVIVK